MPRSGLRCFSCRTEFAHGLYPAGCPRCGEALEAVYEYPGWLEEPGGRGVWRFAPMLPVEDERFRLSLGEGNTPLLGLPAVSEAA